MTPDFADFLIKCGVTYLEVMLIAFLVQHSGLCLAKQLAVIEGISGVDLVLAKNSITGRSQFSQGLIGSFILPSEKL